MNIKYTLLLFGLPHHIPQSVNGRSGKSFGHATINPIHKAHALEIPGETWKNHGLDICAAMKRRTCKFLLIAEAIPDPNSPEAILADELDKVSSDLISTTGKLEKSQALREELANTNRLLLQRIAVLEGGQTERVITQTLPSLKSADTVAPPTADNPSNSATSDAPPDVTAQLGELPYRGLRKLAQAVNLREPNAIQLNPSPTQETLLQKLSAVPYIADLLRDAA